MTPGPVSKPYQGPERMIEECLDRIERTAKDDDAVIVGRRCKQDTISSSDILRLVAIARAAMVVADELIEGMDGLEVEQEQAAQGLLDALAELE